MIILYSWDTYIDYEFDNIDQNNIILIMRIFCLYKKNTYSFYSIFVWLHQNLTYSYPTFIAISLFNGFCFQSIIIINNNTVYLIKCPYQQEVTIKHDPTHTWMSANAIYLDSLMACPNYTYLKLFKCLSNLPFRCFKIFHDKSSQITSTL